jgi:hypothetical protein
MFGISLFSGGSSTTSNNTTYNNSHDDNSISGDIINYGATSYSTIQNYGNNSSIDWSFSPSSNLNWKDGSDKSDASTSDFDSSVDGGDAGDGGGTFDAAASVGVSTGTGDATGGTVDKQGGIGAYAEQGNASVTNPFNLSNEKLLIIGGISIGGLLLYKRLDNGK